MKKNLYTLFAAMLLLAGSLVSVNAQNLFHGVRSQAVPAVSTVGDTVSIAIGAPATESFTVNIYAFKDSLIQTVTAAGGVTPLPALPAGAYRYTVVNAAGNVVSGGAFLVKNPRVHAIVHPNPSTVGDTVSITVSAPATQSFTLTISDTSGAAIKTLTVSGGKTVLPALAIGLYSYSLTDASGNVVAKGVIIVKAPRVSSHVQPNPSHPGDTLKLIVNAPATETFTVNIYAGKDSLIQTLTVNGGTTQLPALAPGFYHYEVLNSSGNRVSGGTIVVLRPHVHTLIAPNPSDPGQGSITIDADPSQTFTLNIYDGTFVLVNTLSVNGGTTSLPASLTTGMYFYTVVNSDGVVVSRGRIIIK